MSDILQDNTGDLVIENNTFSIIEGITEIKQRLTQRLRTFYGEFDQDQTIGVKYFQEILKKNGSVVLRDRLLKNEITNTPGIVGIEKYSFEIDKQTRAGVLNFRAQTIEGNLTAEVTVP